VAEGEAALSEMQAVPSASGQQFGNNLRSWPMVINRLSNGQIGRSRRFRCQQNQWLGFPRWPFLGCRFTCEPTTNYWPFSGSKWPFDNRSLAIGKTRAPLNRAFGFAINVSWGFQSTPDTGPSLIGVQS
jgi:hypothetical protein